MRPSSSLLGASRLPLTTKRGNKDYYKGTRQAYVPGAGHRTGPPGKHVVGGKAKYRIMDDRVRYYVGPGIENINGTALKPYVTTKPVTIPTLAVPSFSPMPPSREGEQLRRPDFSAFSKMYQRLSTAERQALVMESRRQWWEGMKLRFPAPPESEESLHMESEESKTREVEERAGEQRGQVSVA